MRQTFVIWRGQYSGISAGKEKNLLGLRAPCASIGRMTRSLNSPAFASTGIWMACDNPNYNVQLLAALLIGRW